jgi:bacterioferritin-associated ferredoxin
MAECANCGSIAELKRTLGAPSCGIYKCKQAAKEAVAEARANHTVAAPSTAPF